MACLIFWQPTALLAQEKPRKIAFVVGVSKYQKDGLTDLKYAHKDANDLSAELAKSGFEVTKFIGAEAKHKAIRSKLEQFIETASELGKNDVVLISLSGHGVQKIVSVENRKEEVPFYCVYDTLVTNPATMISLNWILTELKDKSGCSSNLLIVDACRNNPDKGARTLDGSTVRELPTKISMLFSSSPGQKSFESDKVKQGVFTHVLLKGMQGAAKNSRGQVKWASLATYVLEEVPLHTADLLDNPDFVQRPNLVGNFVRSPILVMPKRSLNFAFENNASVAWRARLGNFSVTRPATSRGKVFIGTNNGAGYRQGIDAQQDKGVLLCFDDTNGKLLWQLTRNKLESGRVNDWNTKGIVSQPCVEGDRLWVVTNRGEVMCLDTEGFRDGENDGQYKTEELNTKQDADIIWSLDMVEELGVFSHNKFVGDPVIFEDLLFINTSNGVDDRHLEVPSPRSPTFLAIDKNTGKIVWENNQPFDRILHGSWASPAIGIINGSPQVYFPGGDGWLYAFHARTGKLIWKCDLNPKDSVWGGFGKGTRSSVLAKPVVYKNSVIVSIGDDPEHGEGVGHLWRIDATKVGDVSRELGETGKKGRTNPNSGIIWHYGGAKGKAEDEECVFRRTLSSPAIASNGLLFITDLSGYLHCLDVETGARKWEHDMLTGIWASPVLFQNKILIGSEDGEVNVFAPIALEKEPVKFATPNYSQIYATIHVDGNSVYVTCLDSLTKFTFTDQ